MEGRTILTQMLDVPFRFSFYGKILTDSHNIASVRSKSNILQTPHILTSKQSSVTLK